MEITKVFKACIKAAEAKNKVLDPSYKPHQTLLSSSNKPKPESFQARCVAVLKNITKLREFLLTYRKDYLANNLLASSMTDDERDQIDSDAETFIKSCSTTIAGLRSIIHQKDSPPCSPGRRKETSNGHQRVEHRQMVVEMMEGYLKSICQLYAQQQAHRVGKAVDRKRLSRLNPKSGETDDPKLLNSSSDNNKNRLDSANTSTSTSSSSTPKHASDASHAIASSLLPQDSSKDRSGSPAEESDEFTAAEAQMFAEENELLYADMTNVMSEVKQIEGKVISIAQLQEIFQEKILEQSAQVNNIHETAVATTENVNEGNEQIREAIKNSATFRVWILFFLIMCTLSLLFLDWYNN